MAQEIRQRGRIRADIKPAPASPYSKLKSYMPKGRAFNRFNKYRKYGKYIRWIANPVAGGVANFLDDPYKDDWKEKMKKQDTWTEKISKSVPGHKIVNTPIRRRPFMPLTKKKINNGKTKEKETWSGSGTPWRLYRYKRPYARIRRKRNKRYSKLYYRRSR